MKEKIVNLLKKEKKAFSLEELDHMLALKTVEEYQELQECVAQLEEEGTVYHTNKDRYMMMEESPYRKGTLTVNKGGFGFVSVPGMEEDVYINEKNMSGALHGDEVLIEIIFDRISTRYEGRVIKVTKRNLSTVVGEIYFKKGKGYVESDDKKLHLIVEIKKEKTLGAVDGHKVLVELNSRIGQNRYSGQVIKIIGHKDDPGVDILSIIYSHNISDTFPEEVEEELKEIPQEVSPEEKIGRKDLTNEMIFTIDGDDTKDIDDAISIEKLANGNYQLGVHIADVSYYVKEGSALDINAMDRGTSVYLVDRVIPMLPHQLSNGICSLNPEVERLAISCVMEIDQKGNTVDYEIFPSVIKSRIQMTYKKVNQVLEKGVTPEGYEPYVESLQKMQELSAILRKAKIERGYIDFDVDEAKILVDQNCHPVDIVKRYRGVGENMIEDFMIAANECVATHIFYMELPFIYRVHEYPEEEKIKEYLGFISSLGYTYTGNMKDLRPKSLQKLLEFLKDKKEYKILSSLLLRSMKKAVYQPENVGHYGLASKCYTHFTSPIRRYPDTTVHRLLRTYLFNHDLSTETIKHVQERLPFIAENSSARERASIDCEREVEDMKMAEYMEDHIGEVYEGMISGVTNFGMFVELDNLVEGMIRLADLDDFYTLDEKTLTYTGERKKKKYRIGDRVVVKVIHASKEEKTIDFELIKKIEEGTSSETKEKDSDIEIL